MANRLESSSVTISISPSDREEDHPVKKAANLAFDMLVDTYPSMARYEDQLLSSVTFADRGVIQRRRVENKPRESIWLYEHLKKAGLNGDELDKIFYVSIQGDNFHTDITKRETFVPKSTLDAIIRGDEPLQKTMLNSLAGYLVSENIRLLPYISEPRLQDNPHAFMWRFMMRAHLADPFFAERGGKLKGKKQETFYQYQGAVRSFLGRDSIARGEVSYYAIGGKVVCVIEGNPVDIFEFVLGGAFDHGLVSILEEPVYKKILDANPVKGSIADILRPRFGSNEQQTKRIVEILGLSDQSLLDAYTSNRIPELYMDCNDNRLDYFDYAGLFKD